MNPQIDPSPPQNEPLCQALGGIDSKAFDLWVLRTAENGLSFEAIDTSDGNKRVGAYLCTTFKDGEENPIDQELATVEMDEKMGKLCELLDGMHSTLRPEIYKKFNVNEYLEGVNLSVLPSYAGKGIAGKLTQAIEVKAKEWNIGLVYVCCSSHFTARVVQKRDYELIHTLPHDQNLDAKGQKVFNIPEPHSALKCYVKLIK